MEKLNFDEEKIIKKEFDIDFDVPTIVKMKVTGNIQVITAMDGHINGIPINRIHVIEITKDK